MSAVSNHEAPGADFRASSFESAAGRKLLSEDEEINAAYDAVRLLSRSARRASTVDRAGGAVCGKEIAGVRGGRSVMIPLTPHSLFCCQRGKWVKRDRYQL